MDSFFILGFDPGKNLGVSILEIDSINLSIINIHTEIYYLDTYIYTPYGMFNKLESLSHIVHNLLVKYQPLIVGMEQVFKHRFANAVIQLSQYTSMIEYTVRKYNPYIYFLTYPPKSVKKLIGATGDANKDQMLSALKKIEEIQPFLKEDITEHEVDAIAISYISYLRFKNTPEFILLTPTIFNRFRS